MHDIAYESATLLSQQTPRTYVNEIKFVLATVLSNYISERSLDLTIPDKIFCISFFAFPFLFTILLCIVVYAELSRFNSGASILAINIIANYIKIYTRVLYKIIPEKKNDFD